MVCQIARRLCSGRFPRSHDLLASPISSGLIRFGLRRSSGVLSLERNRLLAFGFSRGTTQLNSRSLNEKSQGRKNGNEESGCERLAATAPPVAHTVQNTLNHTLGRRLGVPIPRILQKDRQARNVCPPDGLLDRLRELNENNRTVAPLQERQELGFDMPGLRGAGSRNHDQDPTEGYGESKRHWNGLAWP